MDKSKKPTTKLTVHELIHFWVHNKIDKDICRGNWTFEPDKVYYNSLLVARKYGKKYILIQRFSNNGIFANEISCYDIHMFAKDVKDPIIYKKLPTDEVFNEEFFFRDWYAEEFKDVNDHFKTLSHHKEIAKNPRMKYRLDIDTIKFKNVRLPYDVNFKYKDIIKDIDIKTKTYDKLYYGFVNFRYLAPVTISCKVKDLYPKFKKTLVFTRKEIKELRFRRWHEDVAVFLRESYYRIKDELTIRKSRDIYFNNPKRKAQLEKLLSTIEEKRRLKDINDTRENIIKYIKSVKEWMEFKQTRVERGYHWHRYAGKLNECLMYPDSIKTINQREILTTLQVRVDIDEARKLYKLLKALVNKKAEDINFSRSGKTISGFELNSFKIENVIDIEFIINLLETYSYNIKDIMIHIQDTDGDFNICKDYVLHVGCHKIPWYYIEKFVKMNKLDW